MDVSRANSATTRSFDLSLSTTLDFKFLTNDILLPIGKKKCAQLTIDVRKKEIIGGLCTKCSYHGAPTAAEAYGSAALLPAEG